MIDVDILDYVFSGMDDNPRRVVRIELEMVGFTLRVTVKGGQTYLITEAEEVQRILDAAREFNRKLNLAVADNIELVRNKGGIIIEVKLDPRNTVRSFNIPA